MRGVIKNVVRSKVKKYTSLDDQKHKCMQWTQFQSNYTCVYCTNFKTFLKKQKMTNFYQLKYSKNHFCINVDQYKRLADKLMVFVREL